MLNRKALASAVGCAAIASVGVAATDDAATVADTIYHNARFYTVDDTRPWAEAVAVRNGRYVYVGSAEGVKAWQGTGTELIDLGGAMAMPGINDAHVHSQRGGVKNLYECNFPFNAGPKQIAARVAECVRDNPDALWIRGGQWDSGFFDHHDIGSPREFLDAVSGDKAVILNDDSHHNGWVNSRALQLVGIDASTPDPTDGTIVRDPATGEPNGLLVEGAEQSVSDQLPAWTDEQLRSGTLEAMAIANRFGITGMKEAYASPRAMAAFQHLDLNGQASVHMALAIETPYGHREQPLDYDRIDELQRRYQSDNVHTRFVKVFMDGVPTSSRTAAMLTPYTAAEGDRSPGTGMLHLPADLLTRDLIELDKRGYTVKIHAAGDRSVRVVLDAIAAARRANGESGLRHELAHAGYVDDDDLPRFAALGAVADLSPYLWYPSPIIDSVVAAVGSPRGQHYFPIKALLEAGAPVLAGSDWPAAVETMDPWPGIETMVTRRDPRGRHPGTFWPEQAISLQQTLRIFTLEGARALGLADATGSIEVGKSADLIVLDRDLFAIAADDISEARVKLTLFQGRPVYRVQE